MRNVRTAGLLLASVAALIAALSLADTAGTAKAQDTEAWEYAYLIEVDRIVNHDGAIAAWSANLEDKDYFRAHVFVYERGISVNDRTLNRLKRINALAKERWAMSDADTGLLVRRR